MKDLKSLGFCMPAEWAPHRGTILTWPQKNGCSFPPPYDQGINETYVHLIEVLSEVEEVHINSWDQHEIKLIEHLLKGSRSNLSNVHIHRHQSYEPWARDHGPILLKHKSKGQVIATNWKYNAWGEKYPPYDLDNKIPPQSAIKLGLEIHDFDMVLEGGSIEVNGAGDLITTESCLLNPNRNPNFSRDQIEGALTRGLGVERIHWLKSGIEGDDTDGHIDDLTRFIDKNTLITVVEDNRDDENYQALQDNLHHLNSFHNENGKSFNVVELPMPSPIIRNGQRLPASYANFYIANELIILPIFNVPEDGIAEEILQHSFPDRTVVPMDSSQLIWGLGSFHCITQQIPK